MFFCMRYRHPNVIFLKRDSTVGVLTQVILELKLYARTASGVNQCQPIGIVGFLEDLTSFFNGTRNICIHRKSHFNKKSLGKVLFGV